MKFFTDTDSVSSRYRGFYLNTEAPESLLEVYSDNYVDNIESTMEFSSIPGFSSGLDADIHVSFDEAAETIQIRGWITVEKDEIEKRIEFNYSGYAVTVDTSGW
jgi:hypothetical protein